MGQEVPGQAEAGPLTAAESHPSFHQECPVLVRQQGKVLKHKTRYQWGRRHAGSPLEQQQQGSSGREELHDKYMETLDYYSTLPQH